MEINDLLSNVSFYERTKLDSYILYKYHHGMYVMSYLNIKTFYYSQNDQLFKFMYLSGFTLIVQSLVSLYDNYM